MLEANFNERDSETKRIKFVQRIEIRTEEFFFSGTICYSPLLFLIKSSYIWGRNLRSFVTFAESLTTRTFCQYFRTVPTFFSFYFWEGEKIVYGTYNMVGLPDMWIKYMSMIYLLICYFIHYLVYFCWIANFNRHWMSVNWAVYIQCFSRVQYKLILL